MISSTFGYNTSSVTEGVCELVMWVGASFKAILTSSSGSRA